MPSRSGSAGRANRTVGGTDAVDFQAAAERREAFLRRLERMSEEERLRAARYGGFDRWQRTLWAARFPEQVPLVNGEFEWIALGLADLD